MMDSWTKVEEAKSHWVAGIDPDEHQKAYAAALTAGADGYAGPYEESDALSTVILITVGDAEHNIEDYTRAHPEDPRVAFIETVVDEARRERFGTWKIDASLPFRVLVRPYFTDYAVWEFRHHAAV